jgi:hypothetical protein
MSPSGRQAKIAQPETNKNVALIDAINEIKQFWRIYRQAYEDKTHGQE